MKKLPTANIDSIEMETIGNGKGFSAKVGRLTKLLNMQELGCGVVILEPGEKAWPYHLHYGIEEMFFVLSGEGSIRYDNETYPIKEGDVIHTPTGEGTAHQIINTSSSPLKYLAISSHKSPELCYYPDSGKYGMYAQNSDGSWKTFLTHESSEKQYYDGEEQ